MAKKKHPEHVNHERWLVSYADFITLLFAFFVVLFASGQSDKAKQKQVSAAITEAFSQMAIFDPHSKSPPITNTTGAGANSQPSPVQLPMDAAGSGDLQHQPEALLSNADRPQPITPAELQQRVAALIQKQIAAGSLKSGDLTIRNTPEGLILSLQEGGFFDSGSATIRPSAQSTIRAIAASLPPTPIRIEGHTDNIPISSALYASNWELSSARASAITRFLLDHSTADPAQFSVAGYAEFHPVASNLTAEGRARNRRVDIVFLQPQPPALTRAAGLH
jgi:chemotaxis protein MotB